MKKTKLILAVVLVLALSLTALPFSGAVFAVDTATPNSYIAEGNFLTNAGFEDSSEAESKMGKNDQFDNEITSGWTTNYGAGDAVTYSIESDAHSGTNSMKISVTQGTDSRLHNKSGLVYDVPAQGRTTVSQANTEYIISAWVKGTAATRIWARTVSDTDTSSLTPVTKDTDNITPKTDEWTLITAKLSSNVNSQLWWCIYIAKNENENTFLLADDVSLTTTEQAIANVNAMINALEPTLADYEQRADDIKQWVTVLGKDAVDYDSFVEKVSLYNSINNPGFEASTTATNATSANGMVVTEGWLENQNVDSGKAAYSIDTTEKHSGDKALKVEVLKSGVTLRLANPGTEENDYTVVVGDINDDTVPTHYTVSYWVKGTAYVRLACWEYDSANSKWGSMNWSATGNAGKQAHSEWTQYNVKVPVTTYNGKKVIRFVLAVSTGDTSDTSVTSWTSWIDDVELIRESDVQEMIDNYTTGNTVLSSKIDSAVATFGTSKLSGYELYLQKKAGGYVYYNENNLFENPSFEVSNTFTSGSNSWTENNSTYFDTVITTDAHSGNNALLSTSKAGEGGGENMIRNLDIEKSANFKVTNDTYLLSFWAKGSAIIRYASYTYDFANDKWNTPNRSIINQNADEWTLYTVEITPTLIDENYYIKWGVAPFDRTEGKYVGGLEAYLDDFQLVTKDQAIANVDAMIDSFVSLDANDTNYARAKADIEQWISKGYVSDDAKVKFYNHLGDMDMDGDCDKEDVAIIQKHLLDNGEFIELYNINEDLVVNICDMVALDSKLA